jgi:hypothetical protein
MTEILHRAGFLFTRTDVAPAVLSADYGNAYRSRGAVIGAPTRSWAARIDALPDDPALALVEGQSRASYLWDFFIASKTANDDPFYFYDFKDDRYYLASFADDELSFEILCAKVFSTGLQFRERRAIGIESPILGFPILDETDDAVLDETGEALLDEGIF